MRPNTDSDKYTRFRKCERCGCKSGLPDFENPPPAPAPYTPMNKKLELTDFGLEKARYAYERLQFLFEFNLPLEITSEQYFDFILYCHHVGMVKGEYEHYFKGKTYQGRPIIIK